MSEPSTTTSNSTPTPAPTHRSAWDAIPWVVAGAASADDTQWVHTHRQLCSECQAEWALHEAVHKGMNAGLHAGVPASLPDLQRPWHKLLARLDSLPAEDLAQAAAQPAPRAAASNWTRWLATAVVVQAVGLGAMGLALQSRWHGAEQNTSRSASASSEGPADYRTLSQAPTPSTVTGTGTGTASLRLVPAPHMNFGTLRDLLAQTGLVAVELGPDGHSLGLAAANGDARTLTQALPLLRASPAVMLAEPITASR